MNTTRKIAVVAATAAVSVGLLGAMAPAAHAKAATKKDTTWGFVVTATPSTTTTAVKLK